MTDVSITGSWGLYTINFHTKDARVWRRKHLSKGERTTVGGALMCEGADRCRDIVRAMDRDGLAVKQRLGHRRRLSSYAAT